MVRALAAWIMLGLVVGCSSGRDTATPERMLCPDLTGGADLLEVSFAGAAASDGEIRVFVSTARGLNDVIVEMERLAIDACRRMGRDLGAPPPRGGASLDEQCEPVRAAVAQLQREGLELRISIAAPRCEVDGSRRVRCEAIASTSADSRGLCEAQSVMYGQCTLPSVTFAAASGSTTGRVDVIRLGATLEENLPRLLYAEMALGRRLANHLPALVAAASRVPGEVKDAGPRGVACAALAADMTVGAVGRAKSLLTSVAGTLGPLRPEIHEAKASGGPS